MTGFPFDELGPRPGDTTGGPWLARKALSEPLSGFLPIGGLMGTTVSDRPAESRRHVRYVICRGARGWTPNLATPKPLSPVPNPTRTTLYRDSLADIPRVPDADAEESAHWLFAARPDLHRVVFPASYEPRTFEPRTSSMSEGRSLVRMPKPKSYTPDATGAILTADRSRAAREQWALERAADAILRAAGESIHRLDVVERESRLPIVSPDPVAFRGVIRWQRPKPCRYESAQRTFHAIGYWAEADADSIGDAMLGAGPVWQVTLCQTVITDRSVRTFGNRGGFGWHASLGRGGRDSRQARRDSVAARPAEATARFGRPVTPMTAAARSLARALNRASAEAVAAARTFTDVLSTSTPGTLLTFDDGTTALVVNRREVTVFASRETGWETVTAGTPREIAQRLALAGLTLAD